MAGNTFEAFVRSRITELRINKGVSEHRMSLDLDKSGSYIRSITCGSALPSLRELFNIIDYFGMTPVEFFAPLENLDSPYAKTCARIRGLSEADIQKVNTFLDMI